LSVLLSADRLWVKVRARAPVFAMSTVPVWVSPGFQLLALRTAEALLELDMVRVPAVNVLLGFALEAEKFAPDPTAIPTAMRTSASTPSVRLGCMRRTSMRDI
jgi:hypothetical protein